MVSEVWSPDASFYFLYILSQQQLKHVDFILHLWVKNQNKDKRFLYLIIYYCRCIGIE